MDNQGEKDDRTMYTDQEEEDITEKGRKGRERERDEKECESVL